MAELNTVLITVIGAPIATVIVGAIAARVGLGYRGKQLEYIEKRLSVIAACLRTEELRCSDEQRQALTSEFQATVDSLLATSINLEEEFVLAWDNHPWWRRRLTVPPPQSALGWTSSILFYLYSVSFLFLVILAPSVFSDSRGDLIWAYPLNLTMSLAVAVVAHWGAVRAARHAVLLERARRVVAAQRTVA